MALGIQWWTRWTETYALVRTQHGVGVLAGEAVAVHLAGRSAPVIPVLVLGPTQNQPLLG